MSPYKIIFKPEDVTIQAWFYAFLNYMIIDDISMLIAWYPNAKIAWDAIEAFANEQTP